MIEDLLAKVADSPHLDAGMVVVDIGMRTRHFSKNRYAGVFFGTTGSNAGQSDQDGAISGLGHLGLQRESGSRTGRQQHMGIINSFLRGQVKWYGFFICEYPIFALGDAQRFREVHRECQRSQALLQAALRSPDICHIEGINHLTYYLGRDIQPVKSRSGFGALVPLWWLISPQANNRICSRWPM